MYIYIHKHVYFHMYIPIYAVSLKVWSLTSSSGALFRLSGSTLLV